MQSAGLLAILFVLISCKGRPAKEKETSTSVIPAHYVLKSIASIRMVNDLVFEDDQKFSGFLFQLHANMVDTASLEGFEQGRQSGLSKKWYPGKRLMEQRFFLNGKKHGNQIAYWENGNRKFEFIAIEDACEGEMQEWNKESQLIHLAHYVNGQEEGVQKLWYNDGKYGQIMLSNKESAMACWEPKIAEMYRIAFLLFSSLLLFACGQRQNPVVVLPFYNEPTFTPVFETDPVAIEKKITHTIGGFSFLNQDSQFISQTDLAGKIHVANFIFSSCGSICPVMTRHLKTVSDSLANDLDLLFLSYTVTPWIDKPYVLKRYKEKNRITNPRWHFLTGNKSEIYTLARRSYFAEEEMGFTKDSTEFLHTEHVILVDKSKRIRGIYNGTLILEMEQLIADIQTLKKESK